MKNLIQIYKEKELVFKTSNEFNFNNLISALKEIGKNLFNEDFLSWEFGNLIIFYYKEEKYKIIFVGEKTQIDLKKVLDDYLNNNERFLLEYKKIIE